MNLPIRRGMEDLRLIFRVSGKDFRLPAGGGGGVASRDGRVAHRVAQKARLAVRKTEYDGRTRFR